MTELLDSPRKVALERQYADVLEADASDMIWALMGTAMHTILERGGINTMGLTEQRLYMDIDGCRVSGQFDYMDSDGIIWDWKLASVWEVMNGVKEAREQQLNAYALLASSNGFKPTGLRVGFILRDWSQSERTQNGVGYPPHQVFVHSIPLWSELAASAFLEDRVRLHREAQASLPECSSEDRWAKEDTYAVYRGDAKRARRVFTEYSDAEQYLRSKDETYSIHTRPGASIRCQSYCPVNLYCDQWRELKR